MANYVFSLATTPAFVQGWTSGVDYGVTGDYFVDPVSGSDVGNAGTSVGDAYATIAKALTQVSGTGGKIKLVGDGVKFRERVTMVSGADNNNRVIIEPYSNHVPIWTGGEVMTGWTPCVSGDAAVVGSNWASMYKKTGVANSTFYGSNPQNANIFENDVQLLQCVAWSGGDLNDKFHQSNLREGFTADSVQRDGSDNILSYTDASVVATYTTAQIENCVLVGMASPNVAFYTTISGVSGNVITITDQTQTYEDNDDRDKFSLANMLPAMEQGQWGYVNNGTTSDLYIWPNDTANVASNIEVCARHECITASAKDNWTLQGIQFQQVATSDSSIAGSFIYQGTQATITKANITIKNCKFYGFSTNKNANRFMIRIAGSDNVLIENNTFENGQGCYGVYLSGYGTSTGTGTDFAVDCVFKRNFVKKTSQTPVWFTGLATFVLAHNRFEQTGMAAHGNKTSLYSQMKDGLVWGNSYVDADGYFTYQRASRLNWLFNMGMGTRSSTSTTGRVFADQNNSSTPADWEAENGEFKIMNNTFWVQPIYYDNASDTNKNSVSLSYTSATTAVTFDVQNNIMHGMIENTAGRVTTSNNNWDTHPDSAFSVNDVQVAGSTMYENGSIGDYRIKAGAAIRSESGNSISSLITSLTSTYGHLFSDWTLDCLGNTITHSAPGIGAVADYDYADLLTDAAYMVTT
jgi:hypothetical protein